MKTVHESGCVHRIDAPSDRRNGCACFANSRKTGQRGLAGGDGMHAAPRSGGDDVAGTQPARTTSAVRDDPGKEPERVAPGMSARYVHAPLPVDQEFRTLQGKVETLPVFSAAADHERRIEPEVRELPQPRRRLPIRKARGAQFDCDQDLADRRRDFVFGAALRTCRQVARKSISHFRFNADQAAVLAGQPRRTRKHGEHRRSGRLGFFSRRSDLPPLRAFSATE